MAIDAGPSSLWRLSDYPSLFATHGGLGGGVINSAPIATVHSHDLLSAYGAAKAGIVQSTRDTATEFGPAGIRANTLLSGDIKTELYAMECKEMGMILGMSRDDVAAVSAQTSPLRRVGR